ncbi:MAG TPA: sensor N-terminal transmembrane domain-containing protein, partial [Allosphingosinicella sp.]|nr:sensor N-terminal transmembrane domain-containing protein [Allosphingosinicella sp.]
MRRSDESALALRWSNRWTLTHRILAVNIFALAILAGSIFYLDSFRTRITQDRVAQTRAQAAIIARAVSAASPAARTELLQDFGRQSATRLRIYGPDGTKLADSWNGAPPTYRLRDPEKEDWVK